MRIGGIVCLAVTAFVSSGTSQIPPAAVESAAPVVAVEREFAADGATRGWAAAFRRYHAPEAIVLQPDPIKAAITLAKIEGDGPTTLLWHPAYAGIARSGDLGFTAGPVQFRGQEGVRSHYFTIWRQQADGSWKWIFDAGTDVTDPAPLAPDADVPMLPVAAAGTGSAKAAIDAIAAIEDSASVDARGTVGRIVATLSSDARVHRVGQLRAIGLAAASYLMRQDGMLAFKPLMREASSAGDLVFSLGEARDQFEGKERLCYYTRVWQFRPEGWRLVFDGMVPRRVPAG
jgi:ketosteroid isomerase-like protein